MVTRAICLSPRFSDLDLRPLSLLLFFSLFQERERRVTGLGLSMGLLLNEQGNVINTNVSPFGDEYSVRVVAPTSLELRRKSTDNLPHTIWAFKLAGVAYSFKSIRTAGKQSSKTFQGSASSAFIAGPFVTLST